MFLNPFYSVDIGSSQHALHANIQNGMEGAVNNTINNLRLAGSGSGSESASDHNGHIFGSSHGGGIAHGSTFGSDQGAGFGQSSRPQLRAVPPPVVTTSTILSHDNMGKSKDTFCKYTFFPLSIK